jgi:hemolysin activation/secretion protein
MSQKHYLKLKYSLGLVILSAHPFGSSVMAQVAPGTLNPGVLQREYLPPSPNQPQLSPTRPTPQVQETPEQPTLPESDLKVVIKKVIFTGNTKISDADLQNLAKPFLGREISFKEIESLVTSVTTLYRSRGYFISLAVLPKQDVSSGELKIQVVEGYIEKIDIQRQNSTTTPNSQTQAPQEPNGPLEQWVKAYLSPVVGNKKGPLTIARLERQLLLTEAAGGIDLASVLSSGSQLGATVLTLQITPNKLQANVGLDDWVPAQLGTVRSTISASTTPVIGIPIGMAASGSYTWPNVNGLTNIYYSATVPLANNGLSSTGTFSYTLTNSSPIASPTLGIDITTGGESYLGSISLRYPFHLDRKSSLFGTAQLDLLNSNNNTLANGLTANNSVTNLRTLRLRLDAARTGQSWSAQAGLQISQGLSFLGSSSVNTIPGLEPVNGYGNLNFTTAQINASYQRSLGEQSPFQLTVRGLGQFAAGPTPSSEQLGYGGSQYGRGVRSIAFLGDQGILGSLELSYANAKIIRGLLVQPYLFLDGGMTFLKESIQQSYKAASTTGIGLRLYSTQSNWLSADAGWGLPIATNTLDVETGTNNSFAYFKLNLGF